MSVQLEVDQLRRLNEICGRFESQVKCASTDSTSLIEFIAAEEDLDQQDAKFTACVLTELLVIELLYLKQSGRRLDEAREKLSAKYAASTQIENLGQLLSDALVICQKDPDADNDSFLGELASDAGDALLKKFDKSTVPISILRYRLIKRLGINECGRTYLAHDPAKARPVVIKTCEVPFNATPEQVERASEAIARAKRLNHPSISPLITLESDKDDLIMVSHYLDLPTLEQAFRNNPLPLERVLELFASLADALRFAHQQDIVHGDLSPEIVFVDGSVKSSMNAIVKDFGWNRSLQKLFQFHTSDGPTEPSPFHAPELTRSGATPASDVYALGMLFQQFCGAGQAKAGTLPLPSWFRKIIDRCAAENLEERYVSAIELVEEFEQIKNSPGIIGRLLGWMKPTK